MSKYFDRKLKVGGRSLAKRICFIVGALLLSFVPMYVGRSRAALRPQGLSSSSAFMYDVVSIKPNKRGGMMFLTGSRDGLTATNATVQKLILEAYDLEENQIDLSGAPKWLISDHYDVDAKMDSATAEALHKLSDDQNNGERRSMLQALLTDRFKLTIHRGTKELPIYALVIAKNGPKLQEAKAGDTYPNGFKNADGVGKPGMMIFGRGQIPGKGLRLTALAQLLTEELDRTVVDKTGLTGKYDFTLKWTPDESQGAMFKGPESPPADISGPSIFTAIQEQLGLRVESKKGPVEILVVDHAERPSEN